jgi:hypothetical protein
MAMPCAMRCKATRLLSCNVNKGLYIEALVVQGETSGRIINIPVSPADDGYVGSRNHTHQVVRILRGLCIRVLGTMGMYGQ